MNQIELNHETQIIESVFGKDSIIGQIHVSGSSIQYDVKGTAPTKRQRNKLREKMGRLIYTTVLSPTELRMSKHFFKYIQ